MTSAAAVETSKEDGTDLISDKSEIFRSRLIAQFHLLDSISEKGLVEVPKYYANDITDRARYKQLSQMGPHGLVRFQVYSNKEKKAVTHHDRRQNRVKNKNSKYPPLDLWAHWVVDSNFFQNCILALILTNCVVLGIQAEIGDVNDGSMDQAKLILDTFDYCTLLVFVLEILLKWLDNFWVFWRNGWNVFDFLVTFPSIIPEVINFALGTYGVQSTTSDLTNIANNMRVFRILRSLKMVTRFRQVRLIALAVAKAFKAMIFITVLLITFAYIFAIAGVIFFDSFSNSTRDLEYKDSFSTLWSALVTLFQLLTLDHWLNVFMDVRKVINPLFAGFYIILWILIGSFIFRNIFIGIMVNNFQSIRNDLFNEIKEIQEREEQDIKMADFAEELNRQIEKSGKKPEGSDVLLGDKPNNSQIIIEENENEIAETENMDEPVHPAQSTELLREIASQHLLNAEHSNQEWQQVVENNLEVLAKEETTFIWPQDSLFHYLMMMEALCENIQERQDLMDLATQSLMLIQDT